MGLLILRRTPKFLGLNATPRKKFEILIYTQSRQTDFKGKFSVFLSPKMNWEVQFEQFYQQRKTRLVETSLKFAVCCLRDNLKTIKIVELVKIAKKLKLFKLLLSKK
jgi:hypothetical protein